MLIIRYNLRYLKSGHYQFSAGVISDAIVLYIIYGTPGTSRKISAAIETVTYLPTIFDSGALLGYCCLNLDF